MVRTPILVAWSGGKDCAWTLQRLRWSQAFEPVGLLTTLTQGLERVAMHGIRRDVLHAQARAAGLPLIESWQPRHPDNASYEAAFSVGLAQAREQWPGICHIAFGDLYLADVRAFRDALLQRQGWHGAYPLWDSDTAALAREIQAAGVQASLCCVDSQLLDAAFAGREFDARLLADLPAQADPCGERGEFHTVVRAGPMFDAPLTLEQGETVLRDERFAFTDWQLSRCSAPPPRSR